MKNYIKPTFTLAGLVPTVFESGGCTISETDKEDLEWMFGGDWSKMFVDTTTDGCAEAAGIEDYCKLSYAEHGVSKLFNSF